MGHNPSPVPQGPFPEASGERGLCPISDSGCHLTQRWSGVHTETVSLTPHRCKGNHGEVWPFGFGAGRVEDRGELLPQVVCLLELQCVLE
jgi:hypothetical protein